MSSIKHLSNRIKAETDYSEVEVYHFRSLYDAPHSFLNYLEVDALDIRLKERLHGGFTVALARNERGYGVLALAFCSEEDIFIKRRGVYLATERLLNFLTKPNNGKWDYNPDNYLLLSNVSPNKDRQLRQIAKAVNTHKRMVKKGDRVFNPCSVLKY